MRVAFDSMEQTARVWIYQADRQLSEIEKAEIMSLTDQFLEKWTAHGKDLRSAAGIFYDQFLVLSVDENFNQASGCSIDSSVHFVEQLGQKFNIDFLDKTKVFYLKNPDSRQLESIPFTSVRNTVQSGRLKPDTLTFNNLVTTKADFDEKWLLPASDTWLKKYFV